MASVAGLLRDSSTRLKERLLHTSSRDRAGDWLCRNTKIKGKPFTFKDHEFQIDIANCSDPRMRCQKPTQVGLSELSLRISMALCALRRHFSLIYVLPSADYAGEFMKTRADPVIEESAVLQGLLVRGSDGAKMKRFGTSFFYMAGAATTRQAISRPADCLVIDEKDFCNPKVLTAYYGRLRHAENPMDWQFSTPTLSGYGINLSMQSTDQRRYLVKCEHCNEWNCPDFVKDVVIPGFQGKDFKQFVPGLVQELHEEIELAYLPCKRCHSDLWPSILNPDRREWVRQVSEVQRDAGFFVKPYDLPKYNSIPKIIRSTLEYEDEYFYNFVLGEVHDSEENQVNIEFVKNQFMLEAPAPSAEGTISELCLGADVGAKRVHVMIGRREGGITKVLYRYELSPADGAFLGQIEALFDKHKCIQGVIDIAPDYSLSRGLHEAYGNQFLMASYRGDIAAEPLAVQIQEEKGVVSIQRTKAFNVMVKEMNRGKWQFAAGSDKELLLSHFGSMKRLSELDAKTGEKDKKWVKTGEDHFLHAAMYLDVALSVVSGDYAIAKEAPMVPGISLRFTGVVIGGRPRHA